MFLSRLWWYMSHQCYVCDVGYSKGALRLSGFNHIFEEFRGKLPRSARALKAWASVAVALEGAACGRELVALIALDLIAHGEVLCGLIVLNSFDIFAREQD